MRHLGQLERRILLLVGVDGFMEDAIERSRLTKGAFEHYVQKLRDRNYLNADNTLTKWGLLAQDKIKEGK